jgi:hypothetical protein
MTILPITAITSTNTIAAPDCEASMHLLFADDFSVEQRRIVIFLGIVLFFGSYYIILMITTKIRKLFFRYIGNQQTAVRLFSVSFTVTPVSVPESSPLLPVIMGSILLAVAAQRRNQAWIRHPNRFTAPAPPPPQHARCAETYPPPATILAGTPAAAAAHPAAGFAGCTKRRSPVLLLSL